MSDTLALQVAEAQEAPGTVAYLESLSPARRRAAAEAGDLNRRQLMAWAALYPEEIPLIGGELPWIAIDLE